MIKWIAGNHRVKDLDPSETPTMRKYPCPLCKLEFPFLAHFSLHLDLSHPDKEKYRAGLIQRAIDESIPVY